MKSKDLQKLVISKRQNGDGPKRIFDDLCGAVSLPTVKRWYRMISDQGTINLSTAPGRPRSATTKETVQKIRRRLGRKKRVTTQKLADEVGISKTSVRRILRNDLRLTCYKRTIVPMLSDEHKKKRVKFANWVRNHFRKDDTMRILFSDEKMFDINGVYNAQNDRIWGVNRGEADRHGGIKPQQKFPQKIMVWLGACSKGVTPLVILKNGTVDHARYITEVLPVALKYGNKVFGDNWTFQQDGARAHTHKLSQQWCRDHFPAFIEAGRWPPQLAGFKSARLLDLGGICPGHELEKCEIEEVTGS